MLLESSPKIQFHKTKEYDSGWVINGFVQDYIY